MIDYIVLYETKTGAYDTIITLEVDSYIEDTDLLEELLTENLKDYLETDDFEIIDYYTLTQTEQANLYRIVVDDVYYNDEYMYKGDIDDKAENFMGQSMEESLDCIKRYRKHIDTYRY
jgi:hypothetical protein